MKNIHLIPTDKPSSLYLGNNGNFVFGMIQSSIQSRNDDFTNQHLYITSDEKFNRDEYVTDGVEVIKATPKLVDAQGLVDRRDWKKIILTTDGNLIKDGVQVIDDEFLQWYIKNPSCESVEIEKQLGCVELDAVCDFGEISCPNAPNCLKNKYKIIIPKEEPKQETTQEEVAEYLGFVKGAKWQQEQDKNKYSEEEVYNLTQQLRLKLKSGVLKWQDDFEFDLDKWFEQFKK